MSEDIVPDSSLGVENLSMRAEAPTKPTEIVKSKFYFEKSIKKIKNNFIDDIIYTVDILLNAAGNAPIMKQRKWTVDYNKDINWVCKFIHKYLKLDETERIVSFVLSLNHSVDSYSFSPSSCTLIKHLHQVQTRY